MRLYNSTSCTPVGTSATCPKWSTSTGFVPKKPGGLTRHTLLQLKERKSLSIDSEDTGMQVCTEGTRNKMGSPIISSATGNSLLEEAIPPILTNQKTSLCKSTQARIFAPKSPAKTTNGKVESKELNGMAPFAVVTRARDSSEERLTTPPQTSNVRIWVGKKENRAPCVDDQDKIRKTGSDTSRSTSFDSLSSASPYPRCASEDSGDDSIWFDFSWDGSQNPFQDLPRRAGVASNYFIPIERTSPSRGHVAIRSPKASTSHCLFPSKKSCNQLLTPKTGNDHSAFVVPTGTSRLGIAKPSQTLGIRRSETIPKIIAPPPKDVEPINFTANPGKNRSEGHLDVAKYSIMLKSGFSFSCVQKAMVRDGVDPAIIDFVAAANSVGTP